jgi:hypothetical protein
MQVDTRCARERQAGLHHWKHRRLSVLLQSLRPIWLWATLPPTFGTEGWGFESLRACL